MTSRTRLVRFAKGAVLGLLALTAVLLYVAPFDATTAPF